jgi:pimeloyl-ACP methyl ester carboxylesterase
LPTIVVDHQRVNYMMHGHGPDVLLIHGWVSSLRMWAHTVGRLTEAGYRATAIDLVGFGDSDKPPTGWYTLDHYTAHLSAVCRQLGLARPVIVGHSMGGTLALSLAAHMAVWAVVACAPVVNGKLGGSIHLLLTSSTTRQMWRWMQAQPFFPKIGAMNMPAAPGLMRDPVRRRNQEDLRRATVNATFGSLKTVVDQSLEDRLRDITAPTLILIGGRDFTVPPEQGKLAARLMPNAQLVEWPSAGHSMIDDRPDEFDRLLIDYVCQLQSIPTS